jgi:hypothetical protein
LWSDGQSGAYSSSVGLIPTNALVLTKPPYFAHLELDFLDCWERLGKELKVSKHQVNRTESTGYMSLVRAHNPGGVGFKSNPLPCPNLSAKTHRQAASFASRAILFRVSRRKRAANVIVVSWMRVQ